MLVAYLSNYVIAEAIGTGAWRWMLGVQAVPSIIFFLLLYLIPKSPRWLMSKKREEEARQVLLLCGAQDVDGEIREIQASLDLEHHSNKEPFFSSAYRFPILLAIMIAM